MFQILKFQTCCLKNSLTIHLAELRDKKLPNENKEKIKLSGKGAE